MADILQTLATDFWGVFVEMAPYLLLGFAVAGILSVTISQRVVERHLGGGGLIPIFKAAALGVPLPLCSCGVIPVAASMRRHGASRASTLSFLLSTPQTGVDSIMVTYSLLGPVFAIFRPVAALVTGLLGGTLVSIFGEKEDNLTRETLGHVGHPEARGSILERVRNAFYYGFVALPQDIGRALFVGLIVAALITAVVPDDFFLGLLGTGILSLVVMMLIGVPTYVCATASVPIAAALMMKGFSPGAALVFLISGPATNAAALVTIWKVLGKRTTAIYLGTVVVTSLLSGILLNSLIDVAGANHHVHIHDTDLPGWFSTGSALFLIAILGYAMISPYFSRKVVMGSSDMSKPAMITVDGMTCNHCVATVERAIREVAGVEQVKVDLVSKKAAVSGAHFSLDSVKTAIENVGYKVVSSAR